MSEKYKKVLIAVGITLCVTIVTFAAIFIGYTQNLKNTSDYGLVTTNTINSVVDNYSENTSQTSGTDDLSINEALNQTLNNFNSTNLVQGETLNTTSTSTENTETSENTSSTEVSENTETETVEEVSQEVKESEPVSFIAPVSGEIITDYANESLIYSETLQEWTTHLGIDIKADKTSVVVASESGTVKSIKNDPRYGLSITISHNDGYETVYSNLLSSEFVNEGDTVEQGQTIGTVGESASFEIAEVPHLHFEMYKDGESVNPTSYLSE